MSERTEISAPALDPKDIRYQPACQEALRPGFDKLYDEAVAAGWEPKQVAYALMVRAAAAVKRSSEDA